MLTEFSRLLVSVLVTCSGDVSNLLSLTLCSTEYIPDRCGELSRCVSPYSHVKMQRKKASKGKSAGLSRLEKVLLPAKATTTYYRGPVTRGQVLRSSKIEVELCKISLLKNWVFDY